MQPGHWTPRLSTTALQGGGLRVVCCHRQLAATVPRHVKSGQQPIQLHITDPGDCSWLSSHAWDTVKLSLPRSRTIIHPGPMLGILASIHLPSPLCPGHGDTRFQDIFSSLNLNSPICLSQNNNISCQMHLKVSSERYGLWSSTLSRCLGHKCLMSERGLKSQLLGF